ISEIQSEWVADLLQGHAKLPREQQMNREIARYHAATAKRYGRSAGHTIQVDFLAYMKEIRRERRMGARRGATGVKRTTAAGGHAARGLHVRPSPVCVAASGPLGAEAARAPLDASAPVTAWVSRGTWLP